MSLLALILTGIPFAASQCTFPAELTGNWLTSTLSTLTFTSDTAGPFFSTDTTLDCFVKEGQKYVLRSPAYSAGPAVFVDYTCLDISKITDTTFHYYELTPPNPDPIFNNERKVTKFNTTEVTVAEVCSSEAPTHPAAFSFMMKEGSQADSVISFPNTVLGEYNATMPGCEEGAFLDVCSDTTRLDFNYSMCGTSPFSSQMIFHAVYSEIHGQEVFVTLFIEVDPPEPDNPFIPFSCMVVHKTHENTSLTIAPGNCQDGQTSTNVTDPGVMMELNKTENCDEVTTEGATTTATTVKDSAGQNTIAVLTLVASLLAVV